MVDPVIVDPVVVVKDPAPVIDPAPKVDPTPKIDPAPLAKADPKPDPAKGVPVIDDWRLEFAKGADGKVDDKELTRLQRFAQRTDMWTSYRALEAKQSSGEKPQANPFPKDGTAEQKAQWRKDNEIPETPQGYLEKLPATLPIQTADKATLDKFIADMHAKNKSPADVADSLAWYYENREAALAAQSEADLRAKVTCDDTLRTKWTGTDFRVNKAAIDNLLDQAPPGVKEQFMDGRTADGTPMASHVPTLQWLASVAREINPAATVVPHSSQPLSAIADEIKAIENLMKTDRGAYNKDEGKQARLRQLYSARDAMKQRAGKAA